MITDRLLVVSGSNNPGSAISGQGPITANANSTDILSLATITTAIANNGGARDIGQGENLFMVFTVVVGFAGTGTVDMQIVTDDNDSISSPTVIGSTGAIAVASLTAGAQFVVRIPPLRRHVVSHHRHDPRAGCRRHAGRPQVLSFRLLGLIGGNHAEAPRTGELLHRQLLSPRGRRIRVLGTALRRPGTAREGSSRR
jgi:hypothetical protein